MKRARVLVVDDHRASAELLTDALRDEGYDALPFFSAAECLAELRSRPADTLLSDLRMDGMDGIGLLREARALDPDLPVILMTAHATLERAIEATRGGAFAFLTKPLKSDEVLVQVRNAAQQRRLSQAVRAARRPGEAEIVGSSVALLQALTIADRAAQSDVTVLITGESGTGKEMFARRIHARGARSSRPFVAVNCGAIPDSLLESELFGHVRGAFTGASAERAGLLEAASGGTLFLDEVGELSGGAQTRLLRFLQEGTIRRVGDVRDRQLDVRVLAATHRDLRAGGFREDLYYRLNVVPVALPPLRLRPDDVPALLGTALRRACDRQGRTVPGFTGETLAALRRYSWPGNVRELFNLAERLAVLCVGDAIELSDLPSEMQPIEDQDVVALPDGDFDLTGFLEGIEERALRRAMHRAGGVKAHAAAALGLERNAFRYKLNKYGIGD
ncbi:MAG: sigma-54-dependent Fis family transcriptional regulator [Alphaproteobacteria bacterium]|nr:sigma-54-dependent Fis family transcriptional regulator [Alphaproteobacteria bacterium]